MNAKDVPCEQVSRLPEACSCVSHMLLDFVSVPDLCP